ncbi:MAG: tRNA 2-thiouridine(34) synthase MnmA [Woeseiaceae bacterium]
MNSIPTHWQKGARIIVGMSGGVDSSVVAWQLLQQGFEVEGLHMTNWEADDEYCSAADDLQDARKVCDQLGIPLHHINFAKEYRDRVFQYFLEEYDRGRTPNPDVLCNREIKFGVFADYAKRLGADGIATGHYARTAAENGRTKLLKGKDNNKDQSYFLHAVRGDAFADTGFPLGNLDKTEVRELATKAGLATHRKRDSTGICFIGERPFRDFLSRYLPAHPGDIVIESGEKIGTHNGLMYYTAGQRQGLGVGGLKGAANAPWYVGRKDLARNELVVVQDKHHRWLQHDCIRCDEPHWINEAPVDGERLTAQVRYRQKDQACTVHIDEQNRLAITFDDPQWAIACGQYAVVYRGDECLGGGAIDSIWHSAQLTGESPQVLAR